jgi:LysR family carnitine catabolism transcriptional activator
MSANISTRLLHAFLALEELKHFTRAAERCHTSQSAFSVMIQKLEAAVGTPLFERDTRKVRLTPEGEIFTQVARSLVAEIDAAFEDMSEYVARRRGRVAVAALPSLAAKGLPAVIAEYRRLYPGVAVTLYDTLSDQCLSLLRQGKVDMALTAPGPNVAEFDSRTLCSDPFYLVCRRDHALAGKRRVRVQDLAGQELIHLAKSSSVRQHVDTLLKQVATVHSGFEVGTSRHGRRAGGAGARHIAGTGADVVSVPPAGPGGRPARNPPRRATDPGGKAQGPGAFHCGPDHAGPGGQTPEYESRGAETRLTGRDRRKVRPLSVTQSPHRRP